MAGSLAQAGRASEELDAAEHCFIQCDHAAWPLLALATNVFIKHANIIVL